MKLTKLTAAVAAFTASTMAFAGPEVKLMEDNPMIKEISSVVQFSKDLFEKECLFADVAHATHTIMSKPVELGFASLESHSFKSLIASL